MVERYDATVYLYNYSSGDEITVDYNHVTIGAGSWNSSRYIDSTEETDIEEDLEPISEEEFLKLLEIDDEETC